MGQGQDELRWERFRLAYENARPSLESSSGWFGVSVPLLEKLRQRRRRVTDRSLELVASGLDIQARLLLHESRVLSALVDLDATSAADFVTSPWGDLIMLGRGCEDLFGRPQSELLRRNVGELFEQPPSLSDGGEPRQVRIRRPGGDRAYGAAITSAAHSPVEDSDRFVTVLHSTPSTAKLEG